MNRNRKYNCALLLTGMIILFGGCKTTHPVATVALSEMGKEERIKSIQYQAIPFNTLSSSLRFSIKPGMKKSTVSANAQLRIIKDKIIQLSLRIPILGTEVARINITPEQITIIDRHNKRYVSESMQTIKSKATFDFDFYNLQALITNQLFIAGKSSISSNDYNTFRWNEDKFFVRLNNSDNQGINYDFISDYSNRIIQTEMYKDKKETNMNWLYKDFGLASNNRLFPMKMTMELTVPNDLITLNLTFNTVDIDTYFEPDTTIPNGYQPIEIEQIIKLIQSF
ncbi:MAG: DUF4292 domain-containing protein [Candidatus Azobacteroides sp.]|nr:DUF4292 domain-containing protein [Candidatus Azobacteroides sp.]